MKKFTISLPILIKILKDLVQLRLYPHVRKIFSLVFQRTKNNQEAYSWATPVLGAHLGDIKYSYKLTFRIIAAFTLTFIVWAHLSYIDEFVHANGVVEPEAEIKMVSHYEGGVIEDIYVKEGSHIKKGQILLKLRNVSSEAGYLEAKKNYYDSWAQIERLKAQLSNKTLVIPKEVSDYSKNLVEETYAKYRNRQEALATEQKILKDQIKQHEENLKQSNERLKYLTSIVKISDEKTKMLKDLLDRQLIAKSLYLQAQVEMENRKMEQEVERAQIPEIEAKISETKNKLHQIQLSYSQRDWADLLEQKRRFAEAERILTTEKDKESRYVVRSPVDGVIKEVFHRTKGSAVLSGGELFSIVPSNDRLVIEAQVLPQDIGFIKLGDPAELKMTSYDYSIYGFLRGKVVDISPDSIQDPKNPQLIYYRVRIQTEKDYLAHNGKHYYITPGMTSQVQIITAKRTIAYYLSKPVIKTVDSALGER